MASEEHNQKNQEGLLFFPAAAVSQLEDEGIDHTVILSLCARCIDDTKES